MTIFFRFLRVQFLRILKLFPKILSFSLLTFALIAVLAFLVVRNMDFSGSKKKLSVGIVGDLSSKYLDFGVNALKMMDSSRYFVDLKILKFDEAKNLLRRGKLSAFVVVPDEFFESVICGENDLKVSYYTASGQEGIEKILKEQVSDIISTLLVHAQAGIFAMERIARSTHQTKNLSFYNNDLNLKYVNWTLERTKLCRVQEAGIAGGLSLTAYYLLAAILLFFAFFGIGAFPFFMNRTKTQFKFFTVNGICCAKQFFCEFSAYFFVQIVFLAIVCASVAFTAERGFFVIENWHYSGAVHGSLSLFLSFVPVCLMISAMQFFLFEFSENIVSMLTLQFLILASLCFLGGCFYPVDFFPEILKKLASFLPIGAAFLFLKASFLQESIFSVLKVIFYAACFCGFSIFIRTLRIRSE